MLHVPRRAGKGDTEEGEERGRTERKIGVDGYGGLRRRREQPEGREEGEERGIFGGVFRVLSPDRPGEWLAPPGTSLSHSYPHSQTSRLPDTHEPKISRCPGTDVYVKMSVCFSGP